MPKILFVNSVCNGSTGKICRDIYKLAEEKGYDCCIAYGRGNTPVGYNTIKIGNEFDSKVHALKTRLFDNHGFCSTESTEKFINDIKKFNPDIIHLHNIHGYYLNVKVLFDFIKKSNIPIVWTLHDCWSFTGHCAYFIYSKCNQWENGCKKCQSLKDYPSNFFLSNVQKNYHLKKESFTGVKNMTLVTPSKWLQDLLNNSFMSQYKCNLIYNGIDLNIFHKKNIKRNGDSLIILGVANGWNTRKGLDTFIELSKKLDDNYKIILVGLTPRQIKKLPNNIIGISRTDTIEDLVDLYNKADVLFNPTLEDNYPTVNLEAQACGTPVVTYDTGGTKETIYSKNSFVVNNLDDFIKLLNTVNFKLLKDNFTVDLKYLDKNLKFLEYIELYNQILNPNEFR